MRRGFVLIVLVVLAAGAALIYRSLSAKPAYDTVSVGRGAIASVVSATGKVIPIQEAKVGFKTGGRVQRVLVKVGDTVEEGQVMADLDSAATENAIAQGKANVELAELKLAQALAGARAEEIRAAVANLEGATAKLDELKKRPTSQETVVAKAALDKAAVAVQDMQSTYDRVSWLDTAESRSARRNLQLATIEHEAAKARYDQVVNGPSAEEVRMAESQVALAQAQVDMKRQGASSEELAILRKQVEVAQLALRQVENQRADIVLPSPLAGTVLAVQVNAGEMVLPQQWAVSVGDTRSLAVRANIDEVDIGKIAGGQDVAITFDAFPGHTVAGKIVEIAPSATLQQGSTVYQTDVSFTAADLHVRPGMAASVDVTAKRKEGALLVPNRAVRTIGRKKMVEVDRGGERVRIEVEVGLYNERDTEIVSGLEEGQEVVLWR